MVVLYIIRSLHVINNGGFSMKLTDSITLLNLNTFYERFKFNLE